jgi:hypothetical protein
MSGRSLRAVEVPRMSLYALSAILSFTSLDICIRPVEYDESLAQGKHNEKGDNYIYKKVNIHLFIKLVIILSYPVPRKRERSLHTCAQDVQITRIVTI